MFARLAPIKTEEEIIGRQLRKERRRGGSENTVSEDLLRGPREGRIVVDVEGEGRGDVNIVPDEGDENREDSDPSTIRWLLIPNRLAIDSQPTGTVEKAHARRLNIGLSKTGC